MRSTLRHLTYRITSALWKHRHRAVRMVRGAGNAGLRLYRRIPIPTKARLAAKDFLFLSVEHFIIRTSLYQSWLRQRTGAARIHALLTPGHLGGSTQELAPMPKAPEDAAWDALPKSALRHGEHVPHASVDVVLPVYRGYDETLNCIHSVLSNPQQTDYELVVLNDASPEPALSAKLRVLCEKGFFTLIENEENKGFVATVNRGMRQHENRDVVLLNSDTEVYHDWLDRMVASAARHPRTATVTPFSNNAEICSYPYFVQDNVLQLELPYAELDALAAEANRGQPEVELPTAVGFCMFIKRSALREVGYFDEQTFGKGYGEENDFCLRASAKGWRHVMAGDLFVRHLGGTSFAKEKLKRIEKAIATIQRLYPHYNGEVQRFIASDPLRDLRANLDLARLKRLGTQSNMLFVSHQVGGGTGKHVKELTAALAKEGMGAFTLHPINGTNGLIGLSHPDAPHIPNLYFSVDDDRALLREALTALNITHLHIHHVIHFPPTMVDFLLLLAAEMHVSYDVTIHDYFSFCPRINLIAGDGTYCGEPDIAGCEQCIRVNPSHAGIMPVWQWRLMFTRLLGGARKRYVPDADVAARMERHFPEMRFEVRPHPEHWPVSDSLFTARESGEKLRIAILGAISQVKGSEIVVRMARDAAERNLPIQFTLIGYTDSTELNAGFPNLTITGAYRERELPELLKTHRPHLILIPTIIPESYCYTLSEAWHYGIPPVVFDIGAQGARVTRSGRGVALPLAMSEDAAGINTRLLELSSELQPPSTYRAEEYPHILESYYGMDQEELGLKQNRPAA